MRPLLALSFVAISACASANGAAGGAAATPETVRIAGGGGGGTMQINTVGTVSSSVTALAYSVDRVWRVLPTVYDSLPVPLTLVDPKTHLLGNPTLKIRRMLGKAPLSRYIDCGNAQGGRSADSYEIILSVQTQVLPDNASGSTITTTVEAQGRPVTLSSEYSKCSSTGNLETAISNAVKARLAAAP